MWEGQTPSRWCGEGLVLKLLHVKSYVGVKRPLASVVKVLYWACCTFIHMQGVFFFLTHGGRPTRQGVRHYKGRRGKRANYSPGRNKRA
ncbi:hypothetical protein AVEN_47254-1 [Araneus ventricosus]|uniref:Uncharacterized protein n=1 Tax=Araneus ventricosus TaxID=182803 RepID=A0A4Y2SZD6_ARAVE|nr:hypothetical protein AVEN_185770-1 [Araneus ventricosus]GBN93627.1 hypothetical protein AVEN_79815-1 [Araneus ventricosus]GBN99770.1 hypothetical protein AVEN_124428-1 [Araneus ventricosus]GBN99772.1 hypothetical protein AVEN_47254-1 [Araneus ventricosus]